MKSLKLTSNSSNQTMNIAKNIAKVIDEQLFWWYNVVER